MSTQDDHLQLLSVFHYVVGAMAMLFGTCFTMYIVMGLAFTFVPLHDQHGEAPPRWFGMIFVVVGTGLVLFGWALGILTILAGRSLARRRRYTFCLFMGAVLCLFMPMGTILGVFTLIVLMKPEVKALFAETMPLSPPGIV